LKRDGLGRWPSSREGGLGRTCLPSRQDGVLGVPRPASQGEPAGRALSPYAAGSPDLQGPQGLLAGQRRRRHGGGSPTELARALTAGTGPGLDGRILTFDIQNRSFEEHVVVRRPQCPACGDPRPNGVSGDAVRPVALESRPPARGGTRSRARGERNETYQRYKHHVSPVSGVVANLWARERTSCAPALTITWPALLSGHDHRSLWPAHQPHRPERGKGAYGRAGPARVPSAKRSSAIRESLGGRNLAVERPSRRWARKRSPSKRLRYSANGSTPSERSPPREASCMKLHLPFPTTWKSRGPRRGP